MDEIQQKFRAYLNEIDAVGINSTWERQSRIFRDFWTSKILNENYPLNDVDIDEVVLILDKNAKGSTKGTIAVAKAMIPQGVWRRLFKEIQSKKKLRDLLYGILTEDSGKNQIELIDSLYSLNKGQKNSLTGQSGNAINAMLFAFNPKKYIAVISIKHRRNVIEYFHLPSDVDFDRDSPGTKIVQTNDVIIEGFRRLGVDASPYVLSAFLYRKLKDQWAPLDDTEPNTPPDIGDADSASEESVESKSSFYMEKELENFLIANWDRTELAQKYELIDEDGEMVSQQYPTEIGKIDILAREKNTGRYVVIELKKNQTSDDTIGQLARYMGWLEAHKTGGKPTQGIVIASAYDAKLSYALKKVNDVEVYTYQVDFKLRAFAPGLSPSHRVRS